VVAGGIDVIYPPEHAELTAEIGRRGLMISELPPGFQPRGQDFPRRNRIISGIALAVVVVEAARRSGTLITARYAGEQGRELLAVPGHPLDPRAEGTNRLIREGATLVTSIADVMEAVGPLLGRRWDQNSAGEPVAASPQPAADVDAPDREHVLAALGPAPVSIDELVLATRLSIRQVRIVLIELDLAGRLERHGGNRISLLPPGC
jgi:DNA processing protein